MIEDLKPYKLAVWAITPKGTKLAQKLVDELPQADFYLSAKLKSNTQSLRVQPFQSLADTVSSAFNQYNGHVFIMAVGIVVRILAPLIRHKAIDPAVVVMDETGQHAISLLSGHIGGANHLTKKIANITHAVPVITTATDLNQVPAIDVIAQERGLWIENPDAVKYINMALLTGQKINLHDPYRLISDAIPESHLLKHANPGDTEVLNRQKFSWQDHPLVFVDDIIKKRSSKTLILRPASLVAGMGCNRNTGRAEMQDFLLNILAQHGLALGSLCKIATIDLKADEPGLLALAKDLKIPIEFFDKNDLKTVKNIKTPSAMVKKHIGVQSVCEAAAILSAKTGKLIVPKHSTRNVTVAVARKFFTL
ncbi:MAG: cobalt-precorrin 5A hydrolase [Desulfobacterales bacterium]|nr:cobalt-precorrin 5A hydrolase [Desulfobacterales bacterium]